MNNWGLKKEYKQLQIPQKALETLELSCRQKYLFKTHTVVPHTKIT